MTHHDFRCATRKRKHITAYVDAILEIHGVEGTLIQIEPHPDGGTAITVVTQDGE